MSKVLLFFLLTMFPLAMLSQNFHSRDSLINVMCEDLNKSKHVEDSMRIDSIYYNHLLPYLSQVSKEDVDSIARSISNRFLVKCPEYLRIHQRMNPGKGDWEAVYRDEKPIVVAKTDECKRIGLAKDLSYLEDNGDVVLVQINNGYWIEKFVDGSYSKLNFTWINDCEFELQFIESNNESRASLSKKGDRYTYEIISKEDLYFAMIAKVPGEDIYLKFKIYFN